MGLTKSSLNLLKNATKNPIGAAMGAFTIAQPLFDISAARKEGYSMGASIGKGLLTYATFELFPGLGFGMLGYELASTGVQVAKTLSDSSIKQINASANHNFGRGYVDTQAAYTMRERSVQAIRNNGINARTVLGNEARMYSRGHYE